MKKINAVTSGILFLIPLFLFAQANSSAGYYGGGHDSLLFDAAENTSRPSDICLIKVTKVIGTAVGTTFGKWKEMTCGQLDSGTAQERRQLKEGDEVMAGESITTGKDSYVRLELNDGKKLFLGKNGELNVYKHYCHDELVGINVKLKKGSLSVDDKNGDPKKDITICTGSSCISVGGTVFTVEIIEDAGVIVDLVKVYEGWVKFSQNMESDANRKNTEDKVKKDGDKAVKLKKLMDDYNSGKLTPQEYTTQMQEIMKDAQETKQEEKSVTINAGYQSRLTGIDKPTEPESFDINEKRWWEN